MLVGVLDVASVAAAVSMMLMLLTVVCVGQAPQNVAELCSLGIAQDREEVVGVDRLCMPQFVEYAPTGLGDPNASGSTILVVRRALGKTSLFEPVDHLRRRAWRYP